MVNKYTHTDYGDVFEKDIRELLLYHKIVDAEQIGDQTARVMLDNGTVLWFDGNEGCGGCSNGWFYIEKFLSDLPDNIITDVKFEDTGGGEWGNEDFSLFVFYEDKMMNLISYSGHDNGYYGTGFRVKAEVIEDTEEIVS